MFNVIFSSTLCVSFSFASLLFLSIDFNVSMDVVSLVNSEGATTTKLANSAHNLLLIETSNTKEALEDCERSNGYMVEDTHHEEQ